MHLLVLYHRKGIVSLKQKCIFPFSVSFDCLSEAEHTQLRKYYAHFGYVCQLTPPPRNLMYPDNNSLLTIANYTYLFIISHVIIVIREEKPH